MTEPKAPFTSTQDSRELLRRIWHGYLKKHTGLMNVAVLFMLIEGYMLGACSDLMRPMFDQFFVEGNSGMLIWVGNYIIAIFVLRAASSVIQKLILTRTALKPRPPFAWTFSAGSCCRMVPFTSRTPTA
ncbi:hypothetical protein GCM10007385_25050 [Tateyamaria omphalii]|uniref:hypothetical protein n=1 Tax=Tateyamaria omphalii TaxID=299262 RepID=UPI0016776F91|nr:hypothetical protein [Tateyamaria omphalii]GGX55482.1 hypothetical protein GCM10007385_25050 [Tateyamaria omphalii]